MSGSNETPPIRVHATLWELSPHGRTALKDLIDRHWPGADRFDVRAMNLLDEGPCPLDLDSPAVLASNSGPGWAWVLHDPAALAPLVDVVYDHDDECPCLKGERAPW